jgi:hypothetical protein
MGQFVALLASTTFASFAVTALVFLTKNWFSERLGRSIAHEYDRKLETVRDELGQQQAVRSTAMSALTAAHLAGYERRLKAVEAVWAETVHFRENLPLYAGHVDMLMPSEYSNALEASDLLRELFEAHDPEAEAKTLWSGRTQVEIERAFAGEYLFALFFAYRAFVGRVAYLLIRSYRKGALKSWHDDSALTQLLAGVLTHDELLRVQQTGAGRLRLVQHLIEAKMLEHIAQIISGEAAATFNLGQAQKIIRAATTAANVPSNSA